MGNTGGAGSQSQKGGGVVPYVSKDRRKWLDQGGAPSNAGELTFCLTRVVQRYVRTKKLSYQTLAETLGALRGVELDVYRRVLAEYEEKKQLENGDVWENHR